MSSKIQVICKEGCGNAPRIEILKDLTIAFLTEDFTYVQEWLSEHIVWKTFRTTY